MYNTSALVRGDFFGASLKECTIGKTTALLNVSVTGECRKYNEETIIVVCSEDFVE